MAKRLWLTVVVLIVPTVAVAQPLNQRLETGVFFTFSELERIGSTDHGVGSTTAGLGGRISWRLAPFVDLDGELSVHPRVGVQGYRAQGLVGAKVGTWFGPVGLHIKVRPGFWYFEHDPFGVIARRGSLFEPPQWASSVEPAIDYGAIVQYASPRNVLLRLDVGETQVRYNARTVPSSGAVPPRDVGGFTTRNLQWSVGVGKRF